MDFEARVKPEYRNLHSDVKESVFCDDFESDDENDVSVKRKFDDNNSLHIKVKKSKVSTYVDHDKDQDDIHLSDEIIRLCKPADNSFSSLKRDLAFLEKLFEEGIRKTGVEDKRLQSIKREIDECSFELKAKEKELDTVNKLIGEQMKEFESMTKQFEVQVKELESKEDQYQGQVEELESKEKHFEGRVKDLETREKQLEGRVRELELKEEDLEGRVKDIKLKEEELDGRVRDLESNKKHFESQIQNFKSKEKQFEGFWKEPELKENKFEVKVEGRNFKGKLFGGQVSDLEPEMNKIDRQLKETELTEKQNEVLTKYIVEEKDSGLQLDKCEKTDPAKLVLDIILNPTIPLCDKKGDNVAVIINDSCIYMLEQLMTISPNIKPCVREEALKLALDLKANMKENTENSLGVLGFLLLLAIYGLVTSFIEDEILEFFAIVAHHRIAMELFRTVGFANKVSDFVENLIKKKKFVEAVRFSCEYNLADKNQLVDLLQEHVRNAKQISETICKNSDSIEIKDKARDREIASLGTVLQCISDHGLEPNDLFNKEIKCRILELKGHRAN